MLAANVIEKRERGCLAIKSGGSEKVQKFRSKIKEEDDSFEEL